MDYKEDNPHNPHEEMYEPHALTQSEEDEAESSEGSYNASDVSCQDEYFEDVEVPALEGKTTGNKRSKYNSNHSFLTTFINFNDQVSLYFLEKSYQALEEALLTEDQVKSSQLFDQNHSKNVRFLKLVKQFFYKIGSNRYTYGLQQKKVWRIKQAKKKKEEVSVDPNTDYFSGSWQKDKFD